VSTTQRLDHLYQANNTHVTEVHAMVQQVLSKHMTVADVCAELGISKSTFYDWRDGRKAPSCIKLPNGGIRIRRVDLERWLESREEAL
jgi:excisionase family DNA binding protein